MNPYSSSMFVIFYVKVEFIRRQNNNKKKTNKINAEIIEFDRRNRCEEEEE